MSRKRNDKFWWKKARREFKTSRPKTYLPDDPITGTSVPRWKTNYKSGSSRLPSFGQATRLYEPEDTLVKYTHGLRYKRKGKGRYVDKTVGTVPIRWRMPAPYRTAEVVLSSRPRPWVRKTDYRGSWMVYSYFNEEICWFPTDADRYWHELQEKHDITPSPSGLLPNWNTVGYGVSANMRNRLNVMVLKKIGDNKASWGIAAAELHKSIGTIAKGFTSLLNAHRAIKRGDLHGAISALSTTGKSWKGQDKVKWASKNLGSRHLEMRYGITPIIIDIKQAVALAQKGLKVVNMGRASEQLVNHIDTTRNTGNARDGGRYHVKGIAGYKVIIHYGVDNHMLRNLNRLGLMDAVQVGWDLTPWSFLVDQLVPVADLLQAAAATAGLSFVSGTSTYFSELTCEYEGWNSRQLSGCKTYPTRFVSPVEVIHFGNTASSRCMDRKVLTSFPKPMMHLKNPFSHRNLATALALINSKEFEKERVRSTRRR